MDLVKLTQLGGPTGRTAPQTTGLEILSTGEYDRRVGEPVVPDLVVGAETADMLGAPCRRATEPASLDRPQQRRSFAGHARRSLPRPKPGRPPGNVR